MYMYTLSSHFSQSNRSLGLRHDYKYAYTKTDSSSVYTEITTACALSIWHRLRLIFDSSVAKQCSLVLGVCAR